MKSQTEVPSDLTEIYVTDSFQEDIPSSPPVGYVQARRVILAVRIVLDVTTIIAAIAMAAWLRFGLQWFASSAKPDVFAHLQTGIFWGIALLLFMASNRLYDEDTLVWGAGEGSRIVRSVAETIAFLSVFVLFTRIFNVSRSWLALTVGLCFIALFAQRVGVKTALIKIRDRGRFRRPALLISRSGTPWPSAFLDSLNEFDVVAHVDPDTLTDFLAAQKKERGGFWESPALILRSVEFSEEETWGILLAAGTAGCPVYLPSPLRSVGLDRLTVRDLGGNTMVRVSPPRFDGVQAVKKRTFDLVIASVALILVWPLLLLITLGILISSGRPIFYKQARVGKDRVPFSMVKFRTMLQDAESPAGAVWTAAKDPRVTWIGKWLRRFSLDELPQLINVVKGEMSMVGPRPEQPVFVSRFDKEVTMYSQRHRIRPGITGWAQAHGLRGNTSLDSRVALDNWYIEHWSIALDVRVLLRTVREVLTSENAY